MTRTRASKRQIEEVESPEEQPTLSKTPCNMQVVLSAECLCDACGVDFKCPGFNVVEQSDLADSTTLMRSLMQVAVDDPATEEADIELMGASITSVYAIVKAIFALSHPDCDVTAIVLHKKHKE